MKKTISMVLALTFMLVTLMGISAMATQPGTVPENGVIVNETFETDYDDINGVGKWSTITVLGGAASSTATGEDGAKVTVTGGQLVIPAGNGSDKIGAQLVIGDSTNYQWGLHPTNSRKKADEYVFEFDASLGANTAIHLANAATSYLQIKNSSGIRFQKGAVNPESDNKDSIFLPKGNGMQHYKIVMRPECVDAYGKTLVSYNSSSKKYYYADGTEGSLAALIVKADVYVDGKCYVMGELARQFTSSPGGRAILTFNILGDKNCGESVIDNLEFYYLDGEKRSDVTFKYQYKNEAGNYETLFDDSKPAEKMNADGSRLVTEIRYDGTQTAAEAVKVYLAQFDKDGKLKSVNIENDTVSAGSTDKTTVIIQSTTAEPLFEDVQDDDYLQAFAWTADGMVPLCAERTAGTIAE